MESERKSFGPFGKIDVNFRTDTIVNYLYKLSEKDYNKQPLSIRQALEFIYDYTKEKKNMETVCTCKSCGCQSWIVSENKIICRGCNKEYKFDADTLAKSLINLTNDNY